MTGAPTAAPFTFRHELDDDLLDPAAVVSLLERQQDAVAEVIRGDGSILAPSKNDAVDVAPVDLARSIAEGRSAHLIRVSRPHADSRYGPLLDAATAPHYDTVVAEEGFSASGARVFFAGPRSVTNVHIDRLHGFLFQVRGTKRLTIARVAQPADRDVELDRACATGEVSAKRPLEVVAEFDLGPGDGVFIPACTFHAALVGETPSVAVSAVIRTPVTDRMVAVRTCNHHLRRLHLSPRPTGGRFDAAKVLAVRARFAMAKGKH